MARTCPSLLPKFHFGFRPTVWTNKKAAFTPGLMKIMCCKQQNFDATLYAWATPRALSELEEKPFPLYLLLHRDL